MKSGRANILTPAQLDQLLGFIGTTHADDPLRALRDAAMVMFSFKGALRACEIGGLNWKDVRDALGRVGKGIYNPVTQETEDYFEVPNGIAKKGHGRFLPMHPALKLTLQHLEQALGPARARSGHPVIQSLWRKYEQAPARMAPHTVVERMRNLFIEAGFDGCSSHSGRRTAITSLAITANRHDCSLIDVQQFAGHANLADTQVYVEASPFAGRMVRAL